MARTKVQEPEVIVEKVNDVELENIKENDINGFGEEYFKKMKNEGTDYNYKGAWQKMYVYFLNKIFQIKGKKVLDLGCAMGAIASTFKDYGSETIGVDISNYAKEKSKFKNFEFIETPCWDLKDIKDDSIEFVHSMFMFNFIPEDKIKQTFSEIKRVCKNDAIIFAILSLGSQISKNGNETIYPKYLFDEYAAKEGMKDGSKSYYQKLMSTRVPGWDFMRLYQWPYLLYKTIK